MENVNNEYATFLFGDVSLPIVELDGDTWFVHGGLGNCGSLLGKKDLDMSNEQISQMILSALKCFLFLPFLLPLLPFLALHFLIPHSDSFLEVN